MKICTGCGGPPQPLSNFSVSRQGVNGPVYRSRCKQCQAAKARQWFADNKERAADNRRRWAFENTYGITVEQYEYMLSAQGGVCAICGQDEPNEHGRTGTKFRLSVDHCHITGRVRGLLCQKCNRAIGLMDDDVDLLKKAINYLEGM